MASVMSVTVPVVVAAWSAVCLCAVALAERPEFMLGMDDEVTFRRIEDSKDLPLASALWAAFTPADPSMSLGVYEPLTFMFRLLVAQTFGLAPRTFAISGVLLHALATAIAAANADLALRKLQLGSVPWLSGIASAFLSAHPLRAEVVCWSSCHGYLLASIFCLLCWRCRMTERPVGEFLFLGLALLCKAAVVTFPVLLWAWEVAVASPSKQVPLISARAAKRQLRFLPMLLASVLSALLASGGAPADARQLSLGEQWLRACYAAGFYLWQTAVPPWTWTTPRFAVPNERLSVHEPRFAFGLIFVASASLVSPVLYLCGALRWWPIGLVWLAYVGLLLPTLGVSNHVWALAADRYVYLPSMCLFIPCLSYVLHRCKEWLGPKIVLAIFVPILLASAWRGHQVARFWCHGSGFLFQAILKENPSEFYTLKDLGTLQLKQGLAPSARIMFAEALKLRSDHAGLLLNMATLLHKSKHWDEAEDRYRRAVQVAQAGAHHCTTRAGWSSARCQPAETELVKAQANFAGLLLQRGRASEAIVVLEADAPWDDAVESARAIGLHHLCLAYRSAGSMTRAYRICRASGRGRAEAMAQEKSVTVDGVR